MAKLKMPRHRHHRGPLGHKRRWVQDIAAPRRHRDRNHRSGFSRGVFTSGVERWAPTQNRGPAMAKEGRGVRRFIFVTADTITASGVLKTPAITLTEWNRKLPALWLRSCGGRAPSSSQDDPAGCEGTIAPASISRAADLMAVWREGRARTSLPSGGSKKCWRGVVWWTRAPDGARQASRQPRNNRLIFASPRNICPFSRQEIIESKPDDGRSRRASAPRLRFRRTQDSIRSCGWTIPQDNPTSTGGSPGTRIAASSDHLCLGRRGGARDSLGTAADGRRDVRGTAGGTAPGNAEG